MPYEGLLLSNQKNRKLGVFGRKLDECHHPFGGNFQMFKCCFLCVFSFINMNVLGIQLVNLNLVILIQDATPKINIVESAWALYCYV